MNNSFDPEEVDDEVYRFTGRGGQRLYQTPE
jgi:hypothetical protein